MRMRMLQCVCLCVNYLRCIRMQYVVSPHVRPGLDMWLQRMTACQAYNSQKKPANTVYISGLYSYLRSQPHNTRDGDRFYTVDIQLSTLIAWRLCGFVTS